MSASLTCREPTRGNRNDPDFQSCFIDTRNLDSVCSVTSLYPTLQKVKAAVIPTLCFRVGGEELALGLSQTFGSRLVKTRPPKAAATIVLCRRSASYHVFESVLDGSDHQALV